jgi:mRNA interferase MazF
MEKSTQERELEMKSGKYIPDRGDIIWLNFTPQTGHEQKGKRPALVISPLIYNKKTSLCLCFPITSKIKGYPFEVKLPTGLGVEGVILSDQIKNLDFIARDAVYICTLPKSIVQLAQINISSLVS